MKTKIKHIITQDELISLWKAGKVNLQYSDCGGWVRVIYDTGSRIVTQTFDTDKFGKEVVYIDTDKSVINNNNLELFPILYRDKP